LTQVYFHDQFFSTWSLPLGVAVVGVLLCIAAGILAGVQAERGAKPWWPVLAVLPIAAMLLLALGLGPVWLARLYGQGLEVDGAGPRPGWVFRQLIGGEVLAWAAAVAATGVGVGVRGLLGGTPRSQLLLPPAAIAALGLVLATAGPLHAGALLAFGPLPLLEAHDGARVHVGHSLDLEPSVSGTAEPGRCEVQPLVFAPDTPGDAELQLRAHCGLLGVERRVVVTGGEDRGPEGFPLVAGHRWTWRHVREWHNQMLWFFPEHGRHEGPDRHLRVDGSSVQGGLNTWTLHDWVDEEGDPTEHHIYRWEGQLLSLIDDEPSDVPFYALGDAAGEGGEDEPAWQACSFGLFPGSDCRCLLAPHAEAALPGPSLCAPRRGAGDDLRAIGSALLAVMTIGLVIVDPDDDPRWVLVRSDADTTLPRLRSPIRP
jgi:hypothetical protein